MNNDKKSIDFTYPSAPGRNMEMFGPYHFAFTDLPFYFTYKSQKFVLSGQRCFLLPNQITLEYLTKFPFDHLKDTRIFIHFNFDKKKKARLEFGKVQIPGLESQYVDQNELSKGRSR